MLKTALYDIKICTEQDIRDKESYHKYLKKCEEGMISFFKSINYEYTPRDIQLFYETTDERLEQSEKRKELVCKTPDVAIVECIKHKLSVFNDFIQQYHIGFIRQLSVNEGGVVSVEIPCSIHSTLIPDNKVEAEKTFEKQMYFLQSLGFQFGNNTKMKSKSFIDNDTNRKLLTELLQSRGAKHIQISSFDGYIDVISFKCKLDDIEKFKATPIVYKEEDIDTLTDGEIIKLEKTANEILFAMHMMPTSESTMSTCGNLMEHYFADMCKMLNFSCSLCEKIENRYKDEREKNMQIRKNETLLGETLSTNEIITILKDLQNTIGEFTSENICFDVLDFKIDRYGIAELQFRYITSNFDCLRKGMKEDILRQTFDVSRGCRSEETLYLLDTAKNKEILDCCIKKINPSAEIRTIDVQKRHGEFIINKFTIYIHNIVHI